jgi:hypothetical protein
MKSLDVFNKWRIEKATGAEDSALEQIHTPVD